MRHLFIGDCHFGVSSNSVVWLENQLKFFNTQFLEVLDTKDIDRVIFAGDLFDIRYSINQQIGLELKKLIRNLLLKYPEKEFFFIAGNHDYYSPLEEFHEYNSYDLVFGEEFSQIHKNVKFINNDPYYDGNGNLYLPWYYTENFQNFSDVLYSIDDDIKNIFCHADLSQWDYSRSVALKNAKVWSGHIHNEGVQEERNLYNLGSMFSFNFSDVNTQKYMYIIEGNEIVEKIENITTPKFKRFYNEEIFELDDEDFRNAYIQLCIFSTNINTARYIERIKEIKLKYAEYNVRTLVIDNSLGDTLETNGINTDIDKYINDNIPDRLRNKYEYIKEKLHSKLES